MSVAVMPAGRSVGLRRFLAAGIAALVLATATFVVAPPGAVRAAPAAPRTECVGQAPVLENADDLLASVYTIPPHPAVTLPADPAWNENPLTDRNWEYQFHALRYVRTLLDAWYRTGDDAYLDRAVFLMQDWIGDNPRQGAPSIMSWNDHSTAWRAMTLVCAAEAMGLPGWLASALDLHGRTLADPDFYVGHGNHALNQAIALLDVACTLDRSTWRTLAARRLEALVLESVDAQGVTNEQSVEYQAYNYRQYSSARRRLEACGVTPPAGFDRVRIMPRFLAHATLPNGRYEMLGDTVGGAAAPYPGTIAEFAATQGRSGPRPTTTHSFYRKAGFSFTRTGWGEKRTFANEVHTSLRFGPGERFHGHDDGASVTLYGFGSRLLVDPGKYNYEKDPFRTWIQSRPAHNVVTVDGLTYRSKTPTTLVAHRTSTRHIDTTVSTTGYRGVTNERRVVFSRKLGYLLVQDRLMSSSRHTYRQQWHLAPGLDPVIGTRAVYTRNERGNLHLRQLIDGTSTRIVSGRTNPIQGWFSPSYGTLVEAPVVQATQKGRSVRFLTLIVPGRDRPRVSAKRLRLTPTGWSVIVTVNGKSERVTVSGSSSSIRSYP